MNLEEIASKASLLDDESKASLASRLLQSLPPPDHYVVDEEVFRRMQEAEDDSSLMISHEEFVAGIRRNSVSNGASGDETLDEAETRKIQQALHEANGNKSKAAEMLGITRRRLYSRMKVLGFGEEEA